MTAYVYLIRLDGAPKYVGFTTQTIEKRWKQHQKDAKRAAQGKRSDGPLQKALRKYNITQFTIESLYESEDVEHTKAMEIHHIWLQQTFGRGGYNLTIGGDGICVEGSFNHLEFSLERREALRISAMGRKHSAETKEKMRQSAMARIRTPEEKEQVRNLFRTHCAGKVRSPETIEKMRRAALQRKKKEHHTS